MLIMELLAWVTSESYLSLHTLTARGMGLNEKISSEHMMSACLQVTNYIYDNKSKRSIRKCSSSFYVRLCNTVLATNTHLNTLKWQVIHAL